jgi:mono/diheme cytochrome c family protein/cytochrome c551/c552
MKWYIGLGLGTLILATAVAAVLAVQEPARMERFDAAFHARQIENGASLFENNCRTCHGPQGRGIPGVAPGLNAADLFNGSRLQAIGYAGTVEDYVRGTIAAGRPVPSEGTSYPQRMPTWSREYGGPLRPDQIESLVQFVMNWEQTALAEAGPTPSIPEDEAVGTDITVELPAGDAENGQTLAEGSLGCTACHVLSSTGPAWAAADGMPAVAERAAQRIEQDNYTGGATSAHEYLVESITMPNAFVVEGFDPGVMPGDYGRRLTPQDLADILVYMETFR